MTPTPEMIAMAERIADSFAANRSAVLWLFAKRAALTAIMEVSEKRWTYKAQHGPDGETEYAHVFDGDRLVSVMKLMDAIKIATPSATGSI